MKIDRIIQNSIKRTGVVTAMVTSSFLPTHATKPVVDAFIPSGRKVELAVTNSSLAEKILNKGKTFVADLKAPKDNFNITTEATKDLLKDAKTNNVSQVAKDSSETLKAEPAEPVKVPVMSNEEKDKLYKDNMQKENEAVTNLKQEIDSMLACDLQDAEKDVMLQKLVEARDLRIEGLTPDNLSVKEKQVYDINQLQQSPANISEGNEIFNKLSDEDKKRFQVICNFRPYAKSESAKTKAEIYQIKKVFGDYNTENQEDSDINAYIDTEIKHRFKTGKSEKR